MRGIVLAIVAVVVFAMYSSHQASAKPEAGKYLPLIAANVGVTSLAPAPVAPKSNPGSPATSAVIDNLEGALGWSVKAPSVLAAAPAHECPCVDCKCDPCLCAKPVPKLGDVVNGYRLYKPVTRYQGCQPIREWKWVKVNQPAPRDATPPASCRTSLGSSCATGSCATGSCASGSCGSGFRLFGRWR